MCISPEMARGTWQVPLGKTVSELMDVSDSVLISRGRNSEYHGCWLGWNVSLGLLVI